MSKAYKSRRKKFSWWRPAILPFGLGVIFVLVGLFCLRYSISAELATSRARGWTPVEGFVTELKEQWTDHSYSTRERMRVEYAYEFNGKDFRGRRYCFGRAGFDLVQVHQVGQPVTVFVNPSAPSESVLQIERSGLQWPVPMFGVGGLLIGVLLMMLPKLLKPLRALEWSDMTYRTSGLFGSYVRKPRSAPPGEGL